VQFKEWMTTDSMVEEVLEPFFGGVRAFVLRSLHEVQEDRVGIKFPTNYESFLPQDAPVSYPQPALKLAAAALNPGSRLEEGFDRFKYGKGTAAFRSIANTTYGQQMTPNDATGLQRALKAHIRKVSKEMGLIFELQTFVTLASKGLSVNGNMSVAAAQQEITQHHQSIVGQTGAGPAARIFGFILHHAESMAEEIFTKSKGILRTAPGTVAFSGGTSASHGINRQTADLVIDGVGFSMKFASDTLIGVMETTPDGMYELLGGEDASELQNAHDPEEFVHVFGHLAHNLTQDEEAFNYFVNRLLAGTNPTGTIHRTYPAFRNYVGGQTAVGYSPAIQADFDTHGNKLSVKQGAAISVQTTKTTVAIRVKKGSRQGTKIQIEVKPDGVVIVKMTNLTAQA
jgi:hypothetical protein